MTEKRFSEIEYGVIVDDNDKQVLNLYGAIDVLNEQHETIQQYQILTDELKRQNAKLKQELTWWKYKCGEDLND